MSGTPGPTLDAVLAAAIVFGCLTAILGVLYWRAQRQAADAAAELAQIEAERRADEQQRRDSEPPAELRLFRQGGGIPVVLNIGPGSATEVSISVGDESDVRLSGGDDSPVRKLGDVLPGSRTSALLRQAADDAHVRVVLHWKDPTGYRQNEIESRFGDLPIPRANASITRPKRRRRPKPLGI